MQPINKISFKWKISSKKWQLFSCFGAKRLYSEYISFIWIEVECYYEIFNEVERISPEIVHKYFQRSPLDFLQRCQQKFLKRDTFSKNYFRYSSDNSSKSFFKGFTRNSSRDVFENCTTTLLVQPELNLRIAQGILPGTAPNILPKTLSDTPAESPLKFPPGIFQETLLEIPPRSRYSKDFTRN